MPPSTQSARRTAAENGRHGHGPTGDHPLGCETGNPAYMQGGANPPDGVLERVQRQPDTQARHYWETIVGTAAEMIGCAAPSGATWAGQR